jgi:hypothetical protein
MLAQRVTAAARRPSRSSSCSLGKIPHQEAREQRSRRETPTHSAVFAEGALVLGLLLMYEDVRSQV